MKRLLRIAAVMSTSLLSGCITRCWEQTYFKPDIPRVSDSFQIDRTHAGIEFRVNQAVFVAISECGWGLREAEGGPVSLCLTVIPEEGVLVNFEANRVRFLDSAGSELSIGELEKLSYSIFCKQAIPEPSCSSSFAPNADSELSRTQGANFGGSFSIGVDVSAVRPWRGALDSQHGYVVPHRDKLRRYSASIAFPKGGSAAVSVALPAIIVDGRRFLLPQVVFRKVSEKMCGTFA